MGIEEHEVSAIVKLPAWQGLDVLIDLQAAQRAEYLTPCLTWMRPHSTVCGIHILCCL